MFKDQDKDKDLSSKDKDQDKDQTPKDNDKDKDQTFKDKDQDKDCILVLKESLMTTTRTRTNIIDLNPVDWPTRFGAAFRSLCGSVCKKPNVTWLRSSSDW